MSWFTLLRPSANATSAIRYTPFSASCVASPDLCDVNLAPGAATQGLYCHVYSSSGDVSLRLCRWSSTYRLCPPACKLADVETVFSVVFYWRRIQGIASWFWRWLCFCRHNAILFLAGCRWRRFSRCGSWSDWDVRGRCSPCFLQTWRRGWWGLWRWRWSSVCDDGGRTTGTLTPGPKPRSQSRLKPAVAPCSLLNERNNENGWR